MVQYASDKGYQKMLIMAAKDTYGRGLANILERESTERGIEIVSTASWDPRN